MNLPPPGNIEKTSRDFQTLHETFPVWPVFIHERSQPDGPDATGLQRLKQNVVTSVTSAAAFHRFLICVGVT